MNRRAHLRSLPVVGISSVAGCLDRIPTVGETTLGGFGIYNLHEESHRLDVRIERDGRPVHESSRRIDAYESDPSEKSPPHDFVSCTWVNNSGDYTVFVRSDDRDWHRFGLLDGAVNPPACVISYVRYGDSFGQSDDPPAFTLEIEEYHCSEIPYLEGGCPTSE